MLRAESCAAGTACVCEPACSNQNERRLAALMDLPIKTIKPRPEPRSNADRGPRLLIAGPRSLVGLVFLGALGKLLLGVPGRVVGRAIL